MKKIIIAIAFISISHLTFAQTCEEREIKLHSAIGSFSAGLLYNTYGLIGSVADAFEKNAYPPETVTDLMNAQKNMADNLIKMIDGLIKENIIANEKQKNYIASAKDVIEGLKKQAEIQAEYARTNSNRQQKAYAEQRQKNWKDISKLMGIEE
jgi:hypothetical protein